VEEMTEIATKKTYAQATSQMTTTPTALQTFTSSGDSHHKPSSDGDKMQVGQQGWNDTEWTSSWSTPLQDQKPWPTLTDTWLTKSQRYSGHSKPGKTNSQYKENHHAWTEPSWKMLEDSQTCTYAQVLLQEEQVLMARLILNLKKSIHHNKKLDKAIMKELGWKKYGDDADTPNIPYMAEGGLNKTKWVHYDTRSPNPVIEGTNGPDDPIYMQDLHAAPQLHPNFNKAKVFKITDYRYSTLPSGADPLSIMHWESWVTWGLEGKLAGLGTGLMNETRSTNDTLNWRLRYCTQSRSTTPLPTTSFKPVVPQE
jgi:hypothetical protein